MVTEGPLGTSAIAAARELGIPMVSEFHTNFHSYSRHYGLAWLEDLIAEHLQRLHNRSRMTLVPSRGHGRCGTIPITSMPACATAKTSRRTTSADLFLFPSMTDTWGNVTLEALASGLPVVAYRCIAEP